MYSKDFDFFLENQIAVACSNGGRRAVFFSRLNGEVFKELHKQTEIPDSELNQTCREIHNSVECSFS